MTTTDYLINIVLIGLVIIQIKGGPLTLRTALRPLIIVTAAALYYLRGLPSAGNDVLLDVVLGAVGLGLGVACGMTTRVWKDRSGIQYSRAGVAAAILWVVGIGSRMAFEEYWSHGGTHAIEKLLDRPRHHEPERLDRRTRAHGARRGDRPTGRDPRARRSHHPDRRSAHERPRPARRGVSNTAAAPSRHRHRRVSPMSERIQAVRAEALQRHSREGRQLAPLRVALVTIVVVVAATSQPELGLSGRRLALSLALAVFVVGTIAWPVFRPGPHAERTPWRVAELTVLGASAVTLVAIQPNGVSEIPGSAVVFLAAIALAPALALTLSTVVTAGVAAALAVAGNDSGAGIAAGVLLCAVLGLTGALLRRYRLAQERTELLLAELEEARDDQARAAAAEERAAIARDLHDVLAHSLSGLSIQLEMVRKLTSTAEVNDDVRAAIDGAATLAKEGLLGARDAVGALRDRERLGLENLDDLVAHFSRDLGLDVTISVRGPARTVSPEVGLALYRVTSEALTNVTRHARGATTRVDVHYESSCVIVRVIDTGGTPSDTAHDGSGWGLAGVRERITRLKGTMSAGPAGSGWSVEVVVPA